MPPSKALSWISSACFSRTLHLATRSVKDETCVTAAVRTSQDGSPRAHGKALS